MLGVGNALAASVPGWVLVAVLRRRAARGGGCFHRWAACSGTCPAETVAPGRAPKFTGCPARPVTYTAQDLAQPAPGLIVRLENSLATMDRTLIDVERSIATLTEERDRAAQRLGQPFDRMDQLVAARAHRATIDAKMAAAHQPAEPNPPRPTAAQRGRPGADPSTA